MGNDKALEGLRIALQTEINGIEFYRMAAEHTDDPKGRETFKILANDEITHYHELKRQYESLLKTAQWTEVQLAEPTVFKGESPIFTDEIRTRVKEKHFEMSALSIGALLESDSIDFYRRMKEESSDANARKLFSQLQQWEEKHLEAINKQMELVKENYWADAHFVPLY